MQFTRLTDRDLAAAWDEIRQQEPAGVIMLRETTRRAAAEELAAFRRTFPNRDAQPYERRLRRYCAITELRWWHRNIWSGWTWENIAQTLGLSPTQCKRIEAQGLAWPGQPGRPTRRRRRAMVSLKHGTVRNDQRRSNRGLRRQASVGNTSWGTTTIVAQRNQRVVN